MVDGAHTPNGRDRERFHRARSEAWLHELADRIRVTYEELLDVATESARTGARVFAMDGPYHLLLADPESFWQHFANVTGIEVPNPKTLFYVDGT